MIRSTKSSLGHHQVIWHLGEDNHDQKASLPQDSECAVLDSGQISAWFQAKTGVKQGCVMSGFIRLLAVDWVMRETTEKNNTGIRWKMMEQLKDLDFAGDIALISTAQSHIQRK